MFGGRFLGLNQILQMKLPVAMQLQTSVHANRGSTVRTQTDSKLSNRISGLLLTNGHPISLRSPNTWQ
jgi:hypothetical protein